MPPKKRTKTTSSVTAKPSTKAKGDAAAAARGRNVRGRRGGLQEMPKMPLDVLIEIFAFLHPRDLLNLARTTKDFRAFLMSRNAAKFWERARMQVEDIPDKPAHLSEPAYANLLFFTHCHNCLKGGAHITAYWEISARYCASCRQEVFTEKCDDAFRPIWLEEFEVKSDDIVVYVRTQSNYACSLRYHKVELDKVKREWKALTTKQQKKRYIKDRKKFVTQSHEIAYELGRWQTQLKKRAAADNDSVKANRYKAVLAKLRQEGFGDELDRMDQARLNGLARLDGVSRATKLTDKGWASIRDSVVEYTEKFKSLRLRKQRTEMLDSRLSSLKHVVYALQQAKHADSKERLYAGVADVAHMAQVRTIIEDTPADVTKDIIKTKLKEVLPELIDIWVEERRSEVIDLLRKELTVESEVAPESPEMLQLALASFRCTKCNEHRLRWPEVTEHRCGYWFNEQSKDLYDQRLKNHVGRTQVDTPFPGVKYRGIHCGTQYTRDVISLCGEDPNTVTYAEMTACPVRLACRRCATYAKQTVFDWKGAIAHDSEHRDCGLDPIPGRWMVLSEENAAKARALEEAILAKPVNPQDPGYSDRVYHYHCGWCAFDGGMPSMYSHLEQTHGRARTKIKLDRDFYMTQPYKVEILMYSQVFAESKYEKEQVAAGKAFFASF